MKNKILIFDFDGTIADTYLFLVEIYNGFCKEYGCEKIDTTRLNEYKDKSAAQIIKKLKVPVLKIPAMINRAKKHFHNHMNQVHPFEGIAEALRALKKNNYQMGIVSSNTQNNIVKFLSAHNLNIFDFIHSTNRVLSKHLAIKKLLEKLELSADDVVYIGDEIRDIEAAKKLGIPVVAVTWGYNLDHALKAYNPDLMLGSPGELNQIGQIV